MSSLNINIYEKILNKINKTSIKENIENLEKKIENYKKDIKMFQGTIDNIQDLCDQYSEQYLEPADDSDDELKQYNFIFKNLNKKKNIFKEELKIAQEKYNIALEEKEITDFLKNIIENP